MNMMKVQEEREELSVPAFDLDAEPDPESEKVGQESSILSRLLSPISWLRDERIAAKVNSVFAAFAILGTAMCLVLAFGMSEVWSRYHTSDAVQKAITLNGQVGTGFGQVRYNTSRFLFEQEPEVLEKQREKLADTQQTLGQINDILVANAPQFGPRAARLSTSLDEYNSTFAETVRGLESEGRSRRVVDLAIEISERGEALDDQIAQLTSDMVAHQDVLRETGIDYFLTVLAIVGVFALLAGIALFAGFGYVSRDLATKIGEITQGMTKLANGDRSFEISGSERKDEIGEMLRALAMFKRANRQLELWARERSERAQEEIREEQERARERQDAEERRVALIANVAESFERTVGEVVSHVTSASSELNETASQMAKTADQAADRASALTDSMEEANAGATSAAAASDEFALSIGEISRQAASSSELARLATDATREADTTISKLSESADEVGQIVELIQTIAQRTNLLALNASIEAARGGEAGRGFAVVASEVKDLAMQTSRATEQVADQIRAMQDTTGASVTALRSITKQVQELETTAISIATAVDQQSVAGQDLARSIDLAASGTQQVSGHIENVRDLSLSTGAAAGQVLTSAKELDQQASTLSEQVDAFLKQVRSSG